MARKCELTGKGVMSGNNVSHANNKTRRRFLPNLQDVSLTSYVLKRQVRLKVANSTLRSVDHAGGLDAFLLAARDAELTDAARKLKRDIKKAAAA